MGAVLILTSKREGWNVARITGYLQEMRVRFFVFDTATFPTATKISIALQGHDSIRGHLETASGSHMRLDEVKSVWHRSPEYPQPERSLPAWQAEVAQSEAATALWSLYTTLDAFWVNKPLVGVHLLEHNKLYQMKLAREVGLSVPDTIITNESNELLAFCRAHNNIVAVKQLRGRVYKDPKAERFYGAFTAPFTLEELEELEKDIALSPVLAQEYVPKRVELRTTVVGRTIMSCAIHSQDSERTKHDWRNYDFERVKHEPYKLPERVAAKLLDLMSVLELQFGAVDMILTPSGEHVFLEVNPSGQWGWIEHFTGLPIARTIAELLANPPTIE